MWKYFLTVLETFWVRKLPISYWKSREFARSPLVNVCCPFFFMFTQQLGNFHIFYQIFTDGKLRSLYYYAIYLFLLATFNLTAPDQFRYLQSDCYKVADINDAAAFDETISALEQIGIFPEEQNRIFQIVAGILHLGNVDFVQNAETVHVTPNTQASLKMAAKLFGIGDSLLEQTLTRKTVETKKRMSTYFTPLTKVQAEHARDALAKGIYSRLFKWILSRVNQSIREISEKLLPSLLHLSATSLKRAEESKKPHYNTIGILDIYGFEIFKVSPKSAMTLFAEQFI